MIDSATLAALITPTQFQGMTLRESAIARAWLLKHYTEFDRVEFQVNLGAGQDIGPGFDATTRRQAQLISQKRADVIAFSGSTVTIVEVKERVSLSAMGQLLGYKLLWHAEHPETTAINLVAIGYSALVDVQDVLHAHNITVELYPDVSLVPLPVG